VKGYSGLELRNVLKDQFFIDPEKFNENSVLLNVLLGTNDDILENVYRAVNYFDQNPSPDTFIPETKIQLPDP
jgi:hypothetical protein